MEPIHLTRRLLEDVSLGGQGGLGGLGDVVLHPDFAATDLGFSSAPVALSKLAIPGASACAVLR